MTGWGEVVEGSGGWREVEGQVPGSGITTGGQKSGNAGTGRGGTGNRGGKWLGEQVARGRVQVT